jgi:hypothetical protein
MIQSIEGKKEDFASLTSQRVPLNLTELVNQVINGSAGVLECFLQELTDTRTTALRMALSDGGRLTLETAVAPTVALNVVLYTSDERLVLATLPISEQVRQ